MASWASWRGLEGAWLCVLLEFVDAEGHGHAPPRTVGVDEQREARARDRLEEQCGTASLHDPVGDRGHLEARVHGPCHTDELTALLERAHERAQAVPRHGVLREVSKYIER
jgi:hypothetical protein